MYQEKATETASKARGTAESYHLMERRISYQMARSYQEYPDFRKKTERNKGERSW